MNSPMQYYRLQDNKQYKDIEDNITLHSTPLKSHKKSNSTDYWKHSLQYNNKPNIELKDLSVSEPDGKRVGEKSFSEDNIVITRQTDSDSCTTKL